MKKLVSILLIMVLMLTFAAPALADGSEVYDLCVTEFNAHKPASAYSGSKTIIRTGFDKYGRPIVLSRLTVTVSPDAGFVSNVLKSAGMVAGIQRREDLNMLAIASPAVDGAVLFKYSRTGAVSMVGIYANGYQFYISGGYVVMEAYTPSYWKRVGVLP